MLVLKQHQSQAVLALIFCALSANMLLNYARQQNFLQREQTTVEPITRDSDSEPSPKLVWLMSFPNSGTSYTLRQMERLTNFSMATNYGAEGERSKLLLENEPHGPRCRGLQDASYRPLPKEYILVKTHCTGYSTNSGALALKLQTSEFVTGCATTKPNNPNAVSGSYDPNLVSKAVHVIRDPFHNLISRFNCEHKLDAKGRDRHHRRNLDQGFSEKYSKDSVGFSKFCSDLDSDFDHQYRGTILSNTTRRDVKHTKCHDDVISYVQWHNHAFETTRKLHLPTMVLYYEDYENDFNMTFTNLLDFLHLEERGHVNPFTARHDYYDYFTAQDRDDIKRLIKRFASNHTWNALARYF